MGDFVKVGTLREFRRGRGRVVELDGSRVAVFRTDDGLVALDDTCPHMGTSLSGGRIVDGAVECPWHHWRYDIRTGQSQARPWARVSVYEVRVRGDDVLIRPPASPADPGPSSEEPETDWIRWDPERFLKRKKPKVDGSG